VLSRNTSYIGNILWEFKSQKKSNKDGFDPEHDGYQLTINPYDALGPTVSKRQCPNHRTARSIFFWGVCNDLESLNLWR